MAIEIRRIILEQHEFQAVLNVFGQSGEGSMPVGFVVGYEISQESPLVLVVNVQKPNGEQVKFEMGEQSLAEAIIYFCIKTKIPVSRKSKKTVVLKDGKISLDMSLVNPSFSTNI